MTPQVIGDLSKLPASGFRHHGLWFWAGAGFMLIEGAGFALVLASYIYLMNGVPQWPLTDVAPSLVWGTAATVVFLFSLIPNTIVSYVGRQRDVKATRQWAIVVTAFEFTALVLRGFEFAHLNTRWDQDAYGSIVWAVLLVHTVHLVTDFLDTLFLAIFLHTHPVDDERFADTDDNAGYWAFIVAWQVPIYLLIYWAPRWAP